MACTSGCLYLDGEHHFVAPFICHMLMRLQVETSCRSPISWTQHSHILCVDIERRGSQSIARWSYHCVAYVQEPIKMDSTESKVAAAR